MIRQEFANQISVFFFVKLVFVMLVDCFQETGGEDETEALETTEFLESLGIEADSLPGLTNSHPKNRAQLGMTDNNCLDNCNLAFNYRQVQLTELNPNRVWLLEL
jgi:hypothetical protein